MADRATRAGRAWTSPHRWAARSLDARGDSPQSLFGIVQGALFPDLRRESVACLSGMPFDGLRHRRPGGGRGARRAAGRVRADRRAGASDSPRYLMGVGTPLTSSRPCTAASTCSTASSRRPLGTARRGLHLARLPSAPPGVHKHADERARPGLRLPDLPPPLARLSPSPDEDATRRSGGTCSGSTICTSTTGSCARSGRASWTTRSPRLYEQQASAAGGARPRQPERLHPGRGRPGPWPSAGTRCTWPGEGFASIRHVASGEVMHARTPPMVEAESLYVDQSGLAERLQLGPARECLGRPAARALGRRARGRGQRDGRHSLLRAGGRPASRPRPRHLSFENDLDSLRLAFAHRHHFPYLRHAAPAGLLGSGCWRSSTCAGLTLAPRRGRRLPRRWRRRCPRPDLVFYDLFSGQDARGGLDAVVLPASVRGLRSAGRRAVHLHRVHRGAGGHAGGRLPRGHRPRHRRQAREHHRVHAVGARSRKARRHDLLGRLARAWERSLARSPSDCRSGLAARSRR